MYIENSNSVACIFGLHYSACFFIHATIVLALFLVVQEKKVVEHPFYKNNTTRGKIKGKEKKML